MNYNIFQGKNGIRETVALAWGYPEQATPISEYTREINPGLILGTAFTEDMYLSAFFYLAQRFGFEKPEEYKIAGCWDFVVKDFTIRIDLNSSWVEVMMYGEIGKCKYSQDTPARVAWSRAMNKNKLLVVDIFRDGERPTYEIALINKLAEEYVLQKYPGQPLPDVFPKQDRGDFWFNHVGGYNHKIISAELDMKVFAEKYGEIYSNAYTRRALRTLRSFLNNMLTPIWIRDVPYNIKGVCDDSVDYRRYENNIKFELIKKR